MGHYRLKDDMPSAIILAKKPTTGSLDELKTYQNNEIFLNNGTEFQIRLFNPLQEKIGAKITFNGKTSNHLLVMNPGEDSIIDRFVDEQRKMIFETYHYDDKNPSAKKAVEKNGIIEVSFFKEYEYPSFNTTISYPYTTTPFYYDYTGGNYSSGINTLTLDELNNDGSLTFNTCNMSNTTSNTSSNSLNLNQELEFKSDIKKDKSLKKETGRVEKGEKSDQIFESVNLTFNTIPFHTITYFLKPMSEKINYTKDIRDYCGFCGYRIRNKKWSFCPKCGEKI